jgi:hypothetical protein
MTKRIASLAAACLVAAGLTTFAGSALAGNGNGNGNGNENAPGQVKKDDASTQPVVAATQGGGSADANADASQSGVKPTSDTAGGNKPTSCTTGGGTGSSATCSSTGSNAATAQTAAHADSSKRYGNGKTAAQIANSNAAPAGTTVYGPGNSQPHKVTDCKHKHAVDVHAVKSYSSAACTSQGTTTQTSKLPAANGGTNTPTGGTTQTGTVGTTGTAGTTATGTTAAPTGGVLGTTSTSKSGSAPEGGVLGALEAAGQGSLPFTGFPLWLVAVAAAGLIVFGVALRRQAGATA